MPRPKKSSARKLKAALHIQVTEGDKEHIVNYCNSIDKELSEWARWALLGAVRMGVRQVEHNVPAPVSFHPSRVDSP